MSNHYYSSKPTVESNASTWSFELRGMKLTFTSDAGVFSKNTVDFGSRVLLDSFEEPAVEGAILDVGCGYGPIGITLAKAFSNRTVDMIDVNERAVELAQKNAKANHTANTNAYLSNIYENVQGTYAAIVTNPPIRAGKVVVHEILSDAIHHMVAGSTITAVIQKKQGAPSAQKKMEEVYGNCEVVTKEKGYWILRSVKE